MTNKAVFDTRFFVDYYYSENKSLLNKMRAQNIRKGRYISAVVIHEFYNYALSRKSRETVKTQIADILGEFEVVLVDEQSAQISGELRHKYRLSMGDSMIAPQHLCSRQYASQTTHFKQIQEIQTAWI